MQEKANLAAADSSGVSGSVDLRDVIYNPTHYRLDGVSLLRARLELVGSDGRKVYVHAHDFGLQENRIKSALHKKQPATEAG